MNKDEATQDLASHRLAWRKALQLAVANAEVRPLDNIDDRKFWQNELEVFDRVFATLTEDISIDLSGETSGCEGLSSPARSSLGSPGP